MDDQHFCKPVEPRRKSFVVADDYSIQATNDDATECKASAVRLGYWPDVYVEMMMRKSTTTAAEQRRPPEIHRGYYARVKIVWDMVEKFLNVNCDYNSQISQSEHRNLCGPDYFLLGADIRDLKELQDRLKLVPDLDPGLPTLIISECVLIYMSCRESSDLCQFLSRNFAKSCFLSYDLVNLSDSFGEIFKKNMATRGLTMAGLNICTSLQSQTERFLNAGWLQAKSYLMTEIYEKFIDQKDRERIEKLEFLDEKELLTQLLGHYCVVVAVNDQSLQNMIL